MENQNQQTLSNQAAAEHIQRWVQESFDADFAKMARITNRALWGLSTPSLWDKYEVEIRPQIILKKVRQ